MKQTALPVLVLISVLGMAILTAWPARSIEADHYQKFQDGRSLYSLLNGRIAAGESLQEIERLLGPGAPVVEGIGELRSRLQQEALQFPERFPQGVFDQDMFITYPAGSGTLLLQLRNGFLVNHEPSEFAEYQPEQAIAGAGITSPTAAADVGGSGR